MREDPDFQLGSAELPMSEIMIGGYAPLACPTFDGLWMKASEHGCSARAIEKRLNDAKLTCGYGGRRIKSIARR
jgi:hypothetical protein